jgi:carbon-monoxide dehydrogenase catalytic subunit
VNLGVLKADHVNISLHGHNPVLSEMVVKAAALPEMKKRAEEAGAKGINLVGLCCTGNELLMRKGVPQAGNHLSQELVITTGALVYFFIVLRVVDPFIHVVGSPPLPLALPPTGCPPPPPCLLPALLPCKAT